MTSVPPNDAIDWEQHLKHDIETYLLHEAKGWCGKVEFSVYMGKVAHMTIAKNVKF